MAYKPRKSAKKKETADEGEVCRTVLERYNRFVDRERDNIEKAYEDLSFCWDDKQWDDTAKKTRTDEERPCLVVNRLPQFVHQVTGDMRQMKPSIRVVGVDSRSDKDTAETIAGMIRYIENRSDATRIYTSGADSQVSCGIGAWRVTTEYAAESTFNQEIRIVGVDDAVAIAWDPDAILPTKEDAKWWIVPVDMSREAFKEQYPDASIEDFSDAATEHEQGWFASDFVRVAEYWVKKPFKRTLALFPDGAIVDLTDKPEQAAEATAKGAKVEERDGFNVCRYLITARHVLEGPTDWPGMYIPIVPAVGEEIRIGRRVVRRGLVRSAKDPQRMFNYFCSAQAEVTALQPKAPYLGTETNFKKYEEVWQTANTKAHPFLPYEPDPKNGGQFPTRVAPPVSSQGISEGIALAAENMKAVIGIYDASLGARSNETSGKAIMARQREGDTGTFVYIDNWSAAIAHTGKIIIDLLPHIYDTERMIRIMGDDGKIDLKWINRAVGMQVQDPETGEMTMQQSVENDLTVGAYDVVLKTGPSYTTKREEAREGMIEFIRSAPDIAPVVLDLVAKAQDWPLSEEFAQRLEAVAPPPVQKLIANQKKEQGDEVPPPEPPAPAEQMQMQAMQLELQNKDLQNKKLMVEIQALAQGEPQAPADPTAPARAAAAEQQVNIDAEKAVREIKLLDQKLEIGEIDKALKLAQLHAMQGKSVQSEEQHMADMAERTVSLDHAQQSHHADMVQREVSIGQGAEAHEAKLEQMKKPAPKG